jgi:hypothetical protein
MCTAVTVDNADLVCRRGGREGHWEREREGERGEGRGEGCAAMTHTTPNPSFNIIFIVGRERGAGEVESKQGEGRKKEGRQGSRHRRKVGREKRMHMETGIERMKVESLSLTVVYPPINPFLYV